jgi:hypothetical protein
LFNKGSVGADGLPDFSCSFSTAKYAITMRVSFPPAYEGKRLVVYRSTEPQKENCLSIEAGTSGCTENFVGAVAVVLFTVNQVADGKPATSSIREVVTVLDQSPGLPDRPPFAMSIKLIDGVGSDLQAFGYDESPAPASERPGQREAAKAVWRRYRQNLYLDKDRQPFAVVEWLHTTTRVRILRLESPVLQTTSCVTPESAAEPGRARAEADIPDR